MSDFVNDNLTGSGTFSGRTPDGAGSAWQNYVHHINGINGSDGYGNLLPSLVLNGAGEMSFDVSKAVGDRGSIQSTTPSSADYFVEATIKDTGVGDGDYFTVSLGGRCTADGTATNAVRFELSDLQLHTYYEYDSGTNPSWTGYSPPPLTTPEAGYGGMNWDLQGNAQGSLWRSYAYNDVLVLAASFIGRVVTGYINGVAVGKVVLNDGSLDAIGTAVWGFRGWAVTIDTTKQVLSLRAGYGEYDAIVAPPGNFWTNFVRSTEVDS